MKKKKKYKFIIMAIGFLLAVIGCAFHSIEKTPNIYNYYLSVVASSLVALLVGSMVDYEIGSQDD